ncbi:NAD(P) transhydrogenase subunit alpha [Mycobacterium hodleri]|uniref:proton-translocating NAD(P)(+) transhydrogenase n=1 Tax=Mycolicibacterium hodleri TaxID=49897 RepID=A0A502E2J8_9MYCO|nr:NAD(P) transhydrogenase subunit alpha [Mycolicibacterium hodleri]
MTIGVLAETAAGERRVALDPSAVERLTKAGRVVVVQAGAGASATFADSEYTDAGATLASREQIIATCSVIPVLRYPDADLAKALRPEQMIVGLLDPFTNMADIAELAGRGVITVALELLPRTLSRAQAMDALSSQSSAAGYRAGIVAAAAYTRYLPMMITAAGTATPAKGIVIGTGVAGLQAIATLKRLGAVVTGYDVRSASRGEVESLGAKFLTSSVAPGADNGGYARAMTEEEERTQQTELAAALVGFDIIITTAKVPGRKPPELVLETTLKNMRRGSVCVDLGSSDKGGNVAGSADNTTIVTAGGVTIIGAGELASDVPSSASHMFGRNIVAAIDALAPANDITIDESDEVHQNIVVSHDGAVTNAAVRKALGLDPLPVDRAPAKANAS